MRAFDENCDLAATAPTPAEKYMANALLRVLQDDSLRESMCSAARQRTCCFDIAAVTGQWDALVQSS